MNGLFSILYGAAALTVPGFILLGIWLWLYEKFGIGGWPYTWTIIGLFVAYVIYVNTIGDRLEKRKMEQEEQAARDEEAQKKRWAEEAKERAERKAQYEYQEKCRKSYYGQYS